MVYLLIGGLLASAWHTEVVVGAEGVVTDEDVATVVLSDMLAVGCHLSLRAIKIAIDEIESGTLLSNDTDVELLAEDFLDDLAEQGDFCYFLFHIIIMYKG